MSLDELRAEEDALLRFAQETPAGPDREAAFREVNEISRIISGRKYEKEERMDSGKTRYSVRIGRPERDKAIARVADAYRDEYIQDKAEFERFSDRIMKAQTQADLNAIFDELHLPAPVAVPAPVPVKKVKRSEGFELAKRADHMIHDWPFALFMFTVGLSTAVGGAVAEGLNQPNPMPAGHAGMMAVFLITGIITVFASLARLFWILMDSE